VLVFSIVDDDNNDNVMKNPNAHHLPAGCAVYCFWRLSPKIQAANWTPQLKKMQILND